MTDVRHQKPIPVAAAGEPATLRFVGPVRPGEEHATKPYAIGSGQVLRLLTRQLFCAVPCPDDGVTRPVPDVATEVPTPSNGGVDDDGRTYRIHLREGALWDSQGARPLTAGDFVRGLKRLAHPGAAAVRPYFTTIIDGLAGYCAAYDEALGGWRPNAPDFAQFQASHHVDGLSAESDRMLVVRLTEPANDLIDLLATGFAAAAPREYDYYVPDSHELHRNAPSAGPYRVVRRLSLGRTIVLEPNPRWWPDSDPVRRRTADRIVLEPAPGRSGGWDEAWAFAASTWSGRPAGEPASWPVRGLSPYLLFRPSVDPAVRRAVSAGVDRADLAAAIGAAGGLGAVPQYGIIPPGSPGHRLGPWGWAPLAGAAYADGTTLRLAVPAGDRYARLVRALVDSAARARITLLPGRSPAAGADGWDVALAEWTPAWPGNNGRDLMARLWRPTGLPGPGVDPDAEATALATRALREADARRADELWREVDRRVVAGLTVVPLVAATWPGEMAAALTGGSAHWAPPGDRAP